MLLQNQQRAMRGAGQQQQGVRASCSRLRVAALARPAGARGRQGLRVAASSSALAPQPPSSEEGPFRGGSFGAGTPVSTPFSAGLSTPTMASGGMGGSLGGSATLERSKQSFVMPKPVVQAPKLDNGGSGGNNGKHNHNGGGGGDDGGDDDDYFNEGDDDGEGGDGQGGRAGAGLFRAQAIPEQYDTFSIGAVLSEWMRTVADLPAVLRQAVTMGLFSSAQLVRFFAMDVRPNVTRAVSRRLPPSVAREFVGRLMADPGFVQKAVLEASVAACASLWFEYRARRDNFKGELDLVAINTLGMAAATASAMWMVAPTRSYGAIQKFPWQQKLGDLPNCVFEASGPLRNYTLPMRMGGFAAKLVELSAVGALAGTATSLLSSAAVSIRQRSNPEWQPSVAVPSVGHSSGGLGAYFAANVNTRYQLLGGLDRLLFAHTNYLWMYLALSGGSRIVGQHIGEMTRPKWQGLPDPASLAPVHIPRPAALAKLQLPRRIKKKVSKRVPKYQAQQQQQPSLEGLEQQFGEGAMAASMAATAAAPVPTQMPQLEVAPLSGEASHEEASSMQADAQQQAYEWDGQQQQGGGGYEAAYASSSSSALQGEGLAADGGYVQQQQQQQQPLGEQQVVLGSQGSESEEQHSGRHVQQHRPQYH